MFDLYDTAVIFNSKNPELPFCSAKKDESILLKYAAWCVLKQLPVSAVNHSKAAFFEALLGGEGDALARILSDGNDGDRRGQIEFLYSSIDLAEEFCRLYPGGSLSAQDKEARIEALMKPGVLNRLIGVSVESADRLLVHISEADKTGIEMFYFADAGVLFSVGADVDLSLTSERLNPLAVFKALGDESRLQIVRALLSESLTSAQLAEKIGLTMPTINHHLKLLSACGLVSLLLTSKSGKGAMYRFNRDVASAMLEAVKNEIS
jgi:ArsR family transcriptional regulator